MPTLAQRFRDWRGTRVKLRTLVASYVIAALAASPVMVAYAVLRMRGAEMYPWLLFSTALAVLIGMLVQDAYLCNHGGKVRYRCGPKPRKLQMHTFTDHDGHFAAIRAGTVISLPRGGELIVLERTDIGEEVTLLCDCTKEGEPEPRFDFFAGVNT